MTKHVTGRHAFLFRYVLSFALVFFLPFGFFSYLIRDRADAAMRTEALKNNQAGLSSIAALLDSDINAMDQMVNQMAHLPSFYREKTIRDVDLILDCQAMLKTLLGYNDSYRLLTASWKELPYLFTNSGSCTLSLLSDGDPMQPDFSRPMGLYAERAAKNLYNTSENMLLFTWVYRYASTHPLMQIGFLIDAERYVGASESDGTVCYLYYNGQCLNHQDAPLSPDALAQWRQSGGEPRTVSAPGEGDRLMCMASAQRPGFTAVSVTPLGSALALSFRLQQDFLLCAGICLILVLMVVYLSVKLNYRPLRRLASSIQHLLPRDDTRHNEISAIEQAVVLLKQRNETLLSGSQQQQINSIMTQLLRGAYSEHRPIPYETLSIAGFSPKAGAYQICTLISRRMPPRCTRCSPLCGSSSRSA